jgi:hypothetical protein
MCNIRSVSRDKIIDADYRMAFGNEPVTQMRAKETGTARDYGSWGRSHLEEIDDFRSIN